MAVDSKHPQYSKFLADWTTMEDTYQGERAVKTKGVFYLPATPGQLARGMSTNQPGLEAYNAYLTRAVFPNFVDQSVESMIGIMHHKPPIIKLPERLEGMRENATVKCESLELLLRKINEHQLVTGRFGLLLDVESGQAVSEATPYIATYNARNIINWDDGRRDVLVKQNLNLVVLEETEDERQANFEWARKEKYRVCILGNAETNESATAGGTYMVGVFREQDRSFNMAAMEAPSIGGNTLDRIPFVFVNSKDIVPEPDNPPLIGLASLALSVFRGEADYRQSLFLQGQDTLVTIGGDEDETYEIGAGAHINVVQGGDAKFIGVNGQGLPEMRQALENDRKDAADLGGRLLDNQSNAEASGKALGIRVSARTASVKQVALTGAAALEKILKDAAEWVGADPEQVSVTPNLDFVDEELSGDTMLKWMQSKMLGAPISRETIHLNMQKKGITGFEFEEEMQKIADEDPELTGVGDEEDENVSGAGTAEGGSDD